MADLVHELKDGGDADRSACISHISWPFAEAIVICGASGVRQSWTFCTSAHDPPALLPEGQSRQGLRRIAPELQPGSLASARPSDLPPTRTGRISREARPRRAGQAG